MGIRNHHHQDARAAGAPNLAKMGYELLFSSVITTFATVHYERGLLTICTVNGNVGRRPDEYVPTSATQTLLDEHLPSVPISQSISGSDG